MRDDHPRTAPNYTNACLVMFAVNITWVLVAIWAIWGLIAAACLGYLTNVGLHWLSRVRAARQMAAIRRGKPAALPHD